MPSPTDEILPKMQATRAELLALVEGLDEAALTRRPPDGGWTVRETLAHLVDAERAHRRFVGAALADQPVRLAGFDLDRWNAEHVARRAGQSVAEILADLRAEREATLALLPTIPADGWEKRCEHPALGETSVLQVVRIIGIHERMHMKEMRRQAEVQRLAQ